MRDDFSLNSLNPASYTSIQTTTQITEIGLFFEQDRLTTSDLTQRSSDGNLTAINLWFRFSKKWAGTIGLAPFSTVNYNIFSNQNFGDASDALIQYDGQGGLAQFYFGNGFQISKNLSLGFNASYIFGSIEKGETILSGQGTGLSLENKTAINRPSIDFGAQYSFYLPRARSLTIGVTASDRLRLNTSSAVRVFEVSGMDSLFSEEQSIDDYVLPISLGSGIAYQTRRHLLAMDVKFKNWSEATLDEGLDLQNTTRFSAAYEHKGNPNSTGYWGLVALRSGFYVENNYFTVNNASFNEWGFTLGAGFPLNGNRGMLNISYNYNHNGTTENGLIEQRTQVVVLDIVFRDLWGVRRKFD